MAVPPLSLYPSSTPSQQHSSHSTRPPTPTPIHSLSLHDYRRQQASPSTPGSSTGRRLKRKPAARALNTVEQFPQDFNCSVVSLPATRRAQSDRFAGNRQSLRLSSFRSLPVLPPSDNSPSFDLPSPSSPPRDITNASASPASHKPRGFQGALSPSPRSCDSKTLFKSRKRLPRPKDVEIRPASRQALPSEPSSLDLLATAGLRETSTFTLSKFQFPLPPDNFNQNPPVAPAVLHFRGASFDVVNPHKSLYLCTLEAPEDQDLEHNDYHHRKTSLEPLLPAGMESPGSFENGKRAFSAPDKPVRPLYNDLTAAYSSITKHDVPESQPNLSPPSLTGSLRSTRRPGHDNARIVAQQYPTAPLPPTPAMLSPRGAYTQIPDVLEPEPMPSPRITQNSDDSPSFLQRVFNRKNRGSQEPALEGSTELKPMPRKRLSKGYRNAFAGTMYSAPVVVPDEERAVPDPRISLSDTEITPKNYYDYYDAASIYPTESHAGDTKSLFVDVPGNRRSVPFGVKERVTDYSSEADITSYAYEFVTSPRASQYYPNSSQHFLGVNPDPKDSTLGSQTYGSIINDYDYTHSGNVTEGSLENLIRLHEENLAYQDAHAASQHSSHATLRPPVAGLSQFDFGLEHASHHSGSVISSPTTPGPKTPEDGAFPRIPGIIRASAGAPPVVPLPELTSPTELLQPQVPFFRDASGVSSELSRRGSYGDTRKLLGISGNLDSQSFGQLSVPNSTTSLRYPYARSPARVNEAAEARALDARKVSAVDHCELPSGFQAKGLDEVSPQNDSSNSNRNVFLVSETASPRKTSQSRPPPSRQMSTQGGRVTPSETSMASPLRKQAIIANAEHTQPEPGSGGIPMMWRKASPGPQMKFAFEVPESDAGNEDEDTDGDWETIGPSRPHLKRGEDSFLHSAADSMNSMVGRQPQVSLYDLMRDGELDPKFDFSNCPVPEITVKHSNTNPWSSPKRMDEDHVNPFNTPPPGLSPAIPRFPNDSQLTFLNPDKRTSNAHFDQRDSIVEEGSNPQNRTAAHAGAYDSISNQTLFRDFADAPDAGLNSTRSELEPDRDNSFEKLTVLGPKGNLTGTPMGTSMREVGSSLAPSSTPQPTWSSQPDQPSSSTPAPIHIRSPQSHFSPSHQSPLARYSSGVSDHIDANPEASRGDRHSKYKETLLKLREEAKTQVRSGSMSVSSPPMPVSHGKQRAASMSRPAVSGQNKLRGLRIQPPGAKSIRSNHTHASSLFPAPYNHYESRPTSNSTAVPLNPRYIRFGGHTPVLQRLPRPRSSACTMTADLKNRESWVIFFMCCAWFPPLAVAYGAGMFDPVMIRRTNGLITQCGKGHKGFALTYGIIGTVAAIVSAIFVGIFHALRQ
ncbi:uncharacterized protein K452DRAFT_299950 [Aplosporella prunicola CBS 121167]|uniref:Uncharacterized protein n=1 Tax=Aplosporella prunicola CBS 121167 TaxID=1176127 RepID=A0A6A6BBX4_9PEZI|nr:uncharacterized protein K452DRAFT_299950 [Aplosporella prunicola CBS 121167]KAF2139981.1 hypothetical protein K452DRAFT_299950 [Aplosporella prunicola CBS 121167]